MASHFPVSTNIRLAQSEGVLVSGGVASRGMQLGLALVERLYPGACGVDRLTGKQDITACPPPLLINLVNTGAPDGICIIESGR